MLPERRESRGPGRVIQGNDLPEMIPSDSLRNAGQYFREGFPNQSPAW